MQIVDPRDMVLPPSAIPRPGERVQWYSESRPMRGTIQGHNIRGEAIVRDDFDLTYSRPFGKIRLIDPFNRMKANWFDLPDGGLLLRPEETAIARFRAALDVRIPPGPKYQDLVEEIWGRGFEIFLVGGTVRDLLAAQPANDIDLVTTMPLRQMVGFVQEMYNTKASGYDKRGYIRIGGTPESGDPFIDLKVFSNMLPGTREATFGVGFARDVAYRDFACNAVYYDPKNEVIVDPTGRGVGDCNSRQLCLVCASNAPQQMAQVFIRAVKFMGRGFTLVNGTREQLVSEYLPALRAMNGEFRARYFITQVLSKYPGVDAKSAAMQLFQQTLNSLECDTIWDDLFAKKVEELMADV